MADWRNAADGELDAAVAEARRRGRPGTVDRSAITDEDLNAAIERGDTLAAALEADEPAAGRTGAQLLDLPAPAPVLWAHAPADRTVGAVVSVGEPGILTAPGGSGKSYLALDVALAAVSGAARAHACGIGVRPGPVVLVSYEDGFARLGQRLRALLGRPGAVGREVLEHLFVIEEPAPMWSPALPTGQGAEPTPAFGRIAKRIELLDPSLVIVDPVSAAVGAVGLNDGAGARACMSSLRRLSDETGAGILIVAHDTKAARREARDLGSPGAGAVAGAGQWYDAARGVIYLHSRDGGAIVECLKSNHGRAGWGVELAEVGGSSGRPFRGFSAVGGVLSVSEVYELKSGGVVGAGGLNGRRRGRAANAPAGGRPGSQHV